MGRISFIRPVETGDCFERNDFIVLEWPFLAAKREQVSRKRIFRGTPTYIFFDNPEIIVKIV